MRIRTLVAGFLFSLAVLAFPSPAHAAKNMKIISVSYNQHFQPTDQILFTVVVQNNELTAQGAELVIISTKIGTGTETVLADVGSGAGNVPPDGGTFTFNVTVGRQPIGLYTITFRLLDGDALRSNQVRGEFPVHVGDETETVRVFPEAIHLGAIPPGRYMHQVPIEVTWDFFRFNQLRIDQPFVIRIYTDNSGRYHGVPGAVQRGPVAGLVSMDGRYSIPMKVWNLNYGPDIQETGWDSPLAGPPPVDDDDFWIGPPLLEGVRSEGSAMWVRVPDLTDMTTDPVTWRRLIGQDPDDDRFVSDINPTGDFTLASPFTFYLATEAGASAVSGTYSTTLVVELWTP